MNKTSDNLTASQYVPMKWDEWVVWARERHLSEKQTLLGLDSRYREMYVSYIKEQEHE